MVTITDYVSDVNIKKKKQCHKLVNSLANLLLQVIIFFNRLMIDLHQRVPFGSYFKKPE